MSSAIIGKFSYAHNHNHWHLTSRQFPVAICRINELFFMQQERDGKVERLTLMLALQGRTFRNFNFLFKDF
jgi:hypothetical protein